MRSADHLPSPPAADPIQDSLLFDFDGTLVPIADHPGAVVVTAQLRALVSRVAARFSGRFALVSGRSLADLDRLFGPPPGPVAASHGHELWLPGGRVIRPGRPAALDRAASAARAFTSGRPGVEIEEKTLGIAIHYRLAPDAGEAVQALARRLAEAEGLRLQPGKMVYELTLPGADKGSAIATLMAAPPMRGTRPLFFGDDLTDEAGFGAVAALDGIGVLVGPIRPTRARFGLHDVAAVHRWLEQQGE